MKKLLIILFASLFLASVVGAFACKGEDSRLKKYELGGDFTLKDQDGKDFALKSLRGKVALIFFGYASCPDFCPATLAKINRAYKLMGSPPASKLQTVFISVDPDRDTPETLKKYLSYYKFGAIGLWAKPDLIAKVTKSFGAFYEKRGKGKERNYLMAIPYMSILW